MLLRANFVYINNSTVVPFYPWFCFPSFQLPMVNHGPKVTGKFLIYTIHKFKLCVIMSSVMRAPMACFIPPLWIIPLSSVMSTKGCHHQFSANRISQFGMQSRGETLFSANSSIVKQLSCGIACLWFQHSCGTEWLWESSLLTEINYYPAWLWNSLGKVAPLSALATQFCWAPVVPLQPALELQLQCDSSIETKGGCFF